MNSAADFAAIHAVLELYLDGLYHSDTARLAQVFHPQALYATAVGDQPIFWRMHEYFPVVDARPAPAASGQPRTDRVLSIDGQPLNNTVEFRELLRKGGARPRTLLVEREGGVSAKVIITPQVNTTVNPVSIIAYGEEIGADHIIMGTGDKRGISRLVLGSVAADVAGRAHCTVTIAR